ncbi:MAG TPA: hypothetical protein VIU40_01260, partial [Geobacteraceae bacterium]
MSAPRRFAPAVATLVAALALAVFSPQPAEANHYPQGALCMDCHALSESSMVTGTRLIKRDSFTAAAEANGWLAGNEVPCLFCHRTNKTSSTTGEMKGMEAFFGSGAVSKHNVSIYATYSEAGGLKFDCKDCHSLLGDYVRQNTTTGATTVHGINPDTANVNTVATLRKDGTATVTLSDLTNHCSNLNCHGSASDVTYETGVVAKKEHAFANGITLAGNTTATKCNQCHGTHNSYGSQALITLRKSGTVNNDPSDASAQPYVQRGDCGVCHNRDDGTAYTAKGHGSAGAGGFGCTGCHSDTLDHGFNGTAAPTITGFFKPAFTEDSATSSMTHLSLTSICLGCHGTYSGKIHKGKENKQVGCIDCHEAHAYQTGSNVLMIRQAPPADFLLDTNGSPSGTSSVTSTFSFQSTASSVWYTAAQGQGYCDNADCHGGEKAPNGVTAIYPLNTFFSSGAHSDASQAVGSDCTQCHSHSDGGGAWGAASACTNCHGQPPAPAVTGYTALDEAKTPHAL